MNWYAAARLTSLLAERPPAQVHEWMTRGLNALLSATKEWMKEKNAQINLKKHKVPKEIEGQRL